MYHNSKVMSKTIDVRIKQSNAIEYVGRDTQKRDILIALIDYLIDRRAGYRRIAQMHGMSKSKFECIVDSMPAKFNVKFARKLYEKVSYNQVRDYTTKVLTAKELKSLEEAAIKLKKKSYKAFNKMSMEDIDKLLWKSA